MQSSQEICKGLQDYFGKLQNLQAACVGLQEGQNVFFLETSSLFVIQIGLDKILECVDIALWINPISGAVIGSLDKVGLQGDGLRSGDFYKLLSMGEGDRLVGLAVNE